MWSASLTWSPQASRPATPRRSSLRFSQLLAGAQTPTVSPARSRGGLRGAASAVARALTAIATSYQEARRRVRFEEDRPVDPEPLELARGGRRAVDGELREDPTQDRGELVAVRRSEGNQDAGVVRQAIDNEVPVGRQRVEAGLRGDLGAELLRKMAGEEVRQPGEADLVALEGARRGRHLVPADVLGRLRARLAVGRKSVERRIVHPDPDREAFRREERRIRRGEVRDLGLDDRERQRTIEWREQVVRPGVGRDHHLGGAVDVAVVEGDLR